MTENGISTTTERGKENYESFRNYRGKKYVCYDFRDYDGELFSVVKPTLEECREAKDQWISNKK
jgi:hypothetical protein